MSKVKHHTVNANGIRIHLVEKGEGPLVLLCHGSPETSHSWRHQLSALAEAGFRAVAPDTFLKLDAKSHIYQSLAAAASGESVKVARSRLHFGQTMDRKEGEAAEPDRRT